MCWGSPPPETPLPTPSAVLVVWENLFQKNIKSAAKSDHHLYQFYLELDFQKQPPSCLPWQDCKLPWDQLFPLPQPPHHRWPPSAAAWGYFTFCCVWAHTVGLNPGTGTFSIISAPACTCCWTAAPCRSCLRLLFISTSGPKWKRSDGIWFIYFFIWSWSIYD